MKRRTWGGILSAVLVLLLLGAVPKTVYGVEAIDTTEDECSVTFRLENLVPVKAETSNGEFSGLKEGSGADQIPVTVYLYRMADVDAYGTYQVLSSYKGKSDSEEFEQLLSGIHTGTVDPDWERMSELAANLAGVSPKTTVEEHEGNGYVKKGSRDPDGSITIGGLTVGLYLAAAAPAQSPEYDYTFTPYLISLPDNRYYDTGSDTWIYQLTGDHAVGLKAAWEQRYAKLVIEKTLTSYNQTLGGASFIFEIKAEDKNGTIVYNDVKALVFEGTGTASVTIEGKKIPAGSTVTVEEIYSGACYQISGDKVKTIRGIGADDMAKVDFTNHYEEGKLEGGSSAANHFTYTESGTGGGKWDFDQLKDSSADSVKGGGGQ